MRDEHTHHPCNGVWLCPTCHVWAHAQPFLARGDGLIVSRHEALPGSVVAVSSFGDLLLGCDGSFNYWIED